MITYGGEFIGFEWFSVSFYGSARKHVVGRCRELEALINSLHERNKSFIQSLNESYVLSLSFS